MWRILRSENNCHLHLGDAGRKDALDCGACCMMCRKSFWNCYVEDCFLDAIVIEPMPSPVLGRVTQLLCKAPTLGSGSLLGVLQLYIGGCTGK